MMSLRITITGLNSLCRNWTYINHKSVLQQAQTIAELQEITRSPKSIFLVRQIRKQIQRDSKTWEDGILGLRQKEGQSSQPNALSYLWSKLASGKTKAKNGRKGEINLLWVNGIHELRLRVIPMLCPVAMLNQEALGFLRDCGASWKDRHKQATIIIPWLGKLIWYSFFGFPL